MMLNSTLLFKYESGECTEEEVIELFQNILDTKSYLWLQGQYGRTCQQLLQAGVINHA
jgi:hypothetical protein|tara:strand:- start:57 stop:230 length:174 start_codon:yes stop_codon:yes gene_type:complete